MKIYWTQIRDIVTESPDTKTFCLDQPNDFVWKSGSHTHFALKGFNDGEKPDKRLVRHMSISTTPEEKWIGITTRIRPNCSLFKERLSQAKPGDSVALFKTGLYLPLQRQNKSLYFLSAGVGVATFRPIVLDYLSNTQRIKSVHSLTIDSSGRFLFPNVFQNQEQQNFFSERVTRRADYYSRVQDFAMDLEGYFYIVGSDDFLVENYKLLVRSGINPEQILLDKREEKRQVLLKNAESKHLA